MRRLSYAADRLEGQPMFQILERAKELERDGKEIFHFELGDPDFDTPDYIKEAAKNALDEGHTHYVPSRGMRQFLEAAADVTQKSRGFKPDLEQLLVAPANSQIYYAVSCAVNPGEEVIVPDPGFVSYFSILKFLGVGVKRVPLYEKNEFRLSPEDVEGAVTKNTRMIIMNSPNNPTGAVMNEKEVKEVYDIAKRNDLYLLSDEVYARMVYKDAKTDFFSPSRYDSCRERTIVVNGFSKSYSMTGWRLGVATGPSDLVSKMSLALETITSCISPFVQIAGVEALRGDQGEISERMEEFRKRRDLTVEGLNSLKGVECLKPRGAFYAFPNITGTGFSSEEFTGHMLNDAGVALAPGPIFGDCAEGYVRMCYANSQDNIEKGIEKMRQALDRLM